MQLSGVLPNDKLHVDLGHCLILPMQKDANRFGNHLNPAMLVFIGKLSLSTLI